MNPDLYELFGLLIGSPSASAPTASGAGTSGGAPAGPSVWARARGMVTGERGRLVVVWFACLAAFVFNAWFAAAWWHALFAAACFAAGGASAFMGVFSFLVAHPHEDDFTHTKQSYTFMFATVEDLAGVTGLVVGLFWPVAVPVFLCFTPMILRRSINGPDRQAQADPRDSGSLPGSSVAFNSSSSGSSGSSTGVGVWPATSFTVYTSTYISGGGAPQKPVETVQGDMPILAHRAAKITVTRSGLTFAAINNQFGTFGVDADAQCGRMSHEGITSAVTQIVRMYGVTHNEALRMLGVSEHEAPDLHCGCGFYAVPADVAAQHSADTVDLLVELSGRVIEHETGYRAGHQRVIAIQAEPCPLCGEPSQVAMFSTTGFVAWRCLRHVPNDDTVSVTFHDLERQLGVPVSQESR